MAEVLDVVDLRGQNEATRLLVHSLQGIVNRKGPRLYVLWESRAETPTPSERWLDYYRSKGWIEWRRMPLREAVKKYAPLTKGFVIYDPTMRHSINVATTLSGLYDLVVAHPKFVPSLEALGLRKAWDLRGRWRDKYEAYEWQLKRLFPEASKELIASAMPVEGPLGGPFKPHMLRPIRDLVIMRRAVALDLIPHPDFKRDFELLGEYYRRMGKFAVVVGYPATGHLERPMVETASKFGLVVLLAQVTSVNFSVHCWMPAPKVYRQEHKRDVALEMDKVYVAFGMSDLGLNNVQDRYYGAWDDPKRGSIPVSWWMEALVKDFAPGMLQFYYETRTPNDYFYAAHVGGRIRPSDFPDLEAYLKRGRPYLRACDLKVVAFSNHNRIDERAFEIYSRMLPEVLGFFHGFGPEFGRLHAGNFWVYHRKPWVITAVLGHNKPEGYVRQISELVEQFKDRPIFLVVGSVLGSYPKVAMLEQVARALEARYPGQFRWVRADEFMLALRKFLSLLRGRRCLPSKVEASEGRIVRGSPEALRKPEGEGIAVESAQVEGRPSASLLVSFSVREKPKEVRRLWLRLDVALSRPGRVNLWLWNFSRSTWDWLGERLVDEKGWKCDGGIIHNPWEYVRGGEVRARISASSRGKFALSCKSLELEVYTKQG